MNDRAIECKNTRNNKMIELGINSHRTVYYQEEDPDAIWNEVFYGQEIDILDFKMLCETFNEMVFNKIKGKLTGTVALLAYWFAYRRHGRFITESNWFAQQSGDILSPHQMAFVQRAYTWAHIGCSTLCVWDEEKKENVCMRSLDWQGASALGSATRIFHFKKNIGDPAIDFITVGVVGMLGVLTGMKTNFSVAINYAPWYRRSLNSNTDPTFKLRKLLQNSSINSFDKALKAVEKWRVSSPVFITICGKEKNQACVVEIGRSDKKNIRFADNGLLVQTNNFVPEGSFGYVEAKMSKNNKQKNHPVDEDGQELMDGDWYCGKLIPSSGKRRNDLMEKFESFCGSSVELDHQLQQAFEEPPVWNWETAYWALMRPASGQIRVFARRASENTSTG